MENWGKKNVRFVFFFFFGASLYLSGTENRLQNHHQPHQHQQQHHHRQDHQYLLYNMSTNHRPQLESKRGKVIKIKDSIKHARALPQKKSLKYRQDIPSTISGYGSDSEDEEEEEKEEEKEEERDEISTPPLKKIKIDNTTVAKEESRTSKEEETKEDKESESEESDSDSDDETALLLQEIEKIRQEKLENDKDQNESKVVAIKPGSSTKKKSWRLTTTFNNNKSKQAKEGKKYSTDSLDSEYHQKLMSKYIR